MKVAVTYTLKKRDKDIRNFLTPTNRCSQAFPRGPVESYRWAENFILGIQRSISSVQTSDICASNSYRLIKTGDPLTSLFVAPYKLFSLPHFTRPCWTNYCDEESTFLREILLKMLLIFSIFVLGEIAVRFLGMLIQKLRCASVI